MTHVYFDVSGVDMVSGLKRRTSSPRGFGGVGHILYGSDGYGGGNLAPRETLAVVAGRAGDYRGRRQNSRSAT